MKPNPPHPEPASRPERRFTPEEMKRMMQAGQIGKTDPPPYRPSPLALHDPTAPGHDPEPTTVRSYLRKRDALDRVQAIEAGDRLVADCSPKVPICEAMIVRSEDGVHSIEVSAATDAEAEKLADLVGEDFEGIAVQVFTLEDDDEAPLRVLQPRWSLEDFIKPVSLKATIGDKLPEPKKPKSRLAPMSAPVPRRRGLRHGKWRKAT